MKILILGVCKGRHVIPQVPENNYIFREEIPVELLCSSKDLEKKAELAFWEIRRPTLVEGERPQVHVYVSGLTIAVMAIVTACKKNGHAVTLMHYNRDTGGYYPQEVF